MLDGMLLTKCCIIIIRSSPVHVESFWFLKSSCSPPSLSLPLFVCVDLRDVLGLGRVQQADKTGQEDRLMFLGKVKKMKRRHRQRRRMKMMR